MTKRTNHGSARNRGASPVNLMVDSAAALAASQRLYEKSRHGLRFCCENREVLSVEEAKRRDELEAERKARHSRSRLRRHDDDGDDESMEDLDNAHDTQNRATLNDWMPLPRTASPQMDDDDDLDDEDAPSAELDWSAIEPDDDYFSDADEQEDAELIAL